MSKRKDREKKRHLASRNNFWLYRASEWQQLKFLVSGGALQLGHIVSMKMTERRLPWVPAESDRDRIEQETLHL